MAMIGFIGAGNMGYPMLLGAMKVFGKEAMIFTTATKKRREFIKQETGLNYVEENAVIATSCKYIVFGVKPQYFKDVYNDIKASITKEHILITIAPGISTEDVKEALGAHVRVVFSNDEFTEEEKEVIHQFFTSFGKYELFEERLMNAVVCANGSSPAYVYMFIEALADSVVKYGIPRDKAYSLVAQTVLGAAKMVLETKEHPGKLKDQVCSPGGTTIAAVAKLEEFGLRNAVIKATDACYEKATNIKK
ncbi:MAG: pyrroline-5-carboxylate reductase [Anaerocolumna sp.]|nr:pyrroline-5-carboxylate reductase [Anaerocolumna sp.]